MRIVYALLALSMALPAPAVGKAAPETVVQLERWRTRWVLPVTVAGKERRLLFDTGGGLSFLSKRVLDEAGCRLWGRMTGFRMFGDRVDGPRCSGVALALPGYRVVPPVMGMIDLGKFNEADRPLDGLAGLNLFDGKAVTLDLANGRLIVESKASLAERVRAMRPLKVRLGREVQGLALSVQVEVATTQGPVWMELDSGNGGTVLVSKHVAPLFGLDPKAEGKQRARFAVAPGVTVETADALTPDLILDGNLGMPFLKHWVVTLDLREGRAWVAPATSG